MKKKKKGSNPDEKLMIRGIYITILFVLILLFFPEFKAVIDVIVGLFRYFLGEDFPLSQFDAMFWQGMFVIFSLFFCYQIGLVIVSQFFLPTTIKGGSRSSLKYLRYFQNKNHRNPIVLTTGQMKGQNIKTSELSPTIALIDLNSSLVVEKRIPSKRQYLSGKKSKDNSPELIIRVFGPGVNFLEQGEMIQGIADLRPQIRSNPDIVVKTRDGIELKTTVTVLFTIGEEPQEILVTFIDKDHREIRVVGLSDTWSSDGDSGQMVRVINGFKPIDEIDTEDQVEINHFYERWKSSNLPPIFEKERKNYDNAYPVSPYISNSDRVSAAIYSKAHANLGKEILHWTELPAFVATDILRDSISKVLFDDLYLPDNPDIFPLRDFKRGFSIKVRNQGILSYRFVERLDGNILEAGQLWNLSELNLSPIQYFRRSKILRDRGIKVLAADFSQLEPDDATKNQILDYWKAQWQKQLEIISAENELESSRIISKAKNNTRNEMTIMFSKILEESGSQPKEILTYQLLKVIESAVTDPTTRKLLPRETVNMLWSFRQWLLSQA
jgi:hypothetical protein